MINFSKIRKTVCAEYGVTEQDVINGVRKYTHTDARRVSVYIFTLLNPDVPLPDVARIAEMKRCSMYQSIKRCKNDASIYPEFRFMVSKLTQMLKNE